MSERQPPHGRHGSCCWLGLRPAPMKRPVGATARGYGRHPTGWLRRATGGRASFTGWAATWCSG